MFTQYAIFLAMAATAHAHTMGWAVGMYCLGGNDTTVDEPNNNQAVNPLFMLPKEKWWFQADRGCDKAPPKAGDILNLPAGGEFTVEMAHNRAQTSLSYGGMYASDWPDGKSHPENWMGTGSPPGCIPDDGAMHTNNQSMAAGTAIAISYESDLSLVTMENLVVFTVLENTPWKRIATYEVPKDMPACPEGGCHCAFLWIPNGCGIPNMYMAGYKCNVTGATSTGPLALPAEPPVYCADDPTKCVKGAKQMIAWNQATGNNVSPPNGISPAYGTIMGYSLGAQNDIFASGSGTNQTSPAGPGANQTYPAGLGANRTSPTGTWRKHKSGTGRKHKSGSGTKHKDGSWTNQTSPVDSQDC